MIFSFCGWKAAPGPTLFFFSGLGTSSRPLRSSKMCVLLKEKHHFCIFVYVVLDLDLGPSKSSSGAPKVGLVNFFKFRRADFIASLKFSKNSRGQLGPQEGPGRPLQETKNLSKINQKPSFFRDAILDPKMAPKWSKKHRNAKNPMDFHFAS